MVASGPGSHYAGLVFEMTAMAGSAPSQLVELARRICLSAG